MLTIAAAASACNSSDKKETEEEAYVSATSVAVTKFSIKPNARVMENLDSVYFAIDLDHAVIFNADSLPKGTQVNKLVPLITYPSTVTKAEIEMRGGTTRTGIVDYINNPSDSIDFTGEVYLKLATADDAVSRTYRLKVNVHNAVADSLMWDKVALSTLPSRKPAPLAQKTVSFGKNVISIIRESDNSLTLASCENPDDSNWSKVALSLSFTPDIRSLNATESELFILDDAGNLHHSADGKNWTDAGVNWHAVIGPFGNAILGIAGNDADGFKHDIYPRPAGFTPSAIAPDFPTEAFSNFNSFSSKWAADPIGFLVGGRRNGITSGESWAYDGNSWAKTANHPLPPLANPLLIPYFNYRKTATSWLQTEYSIWLCIGGINADGNINRNVYISYDNGVNWEKAESLLQLPNFMPDLYSADAIVRTSPMSADLSSYWKSYPSAGRAGVKRIQYFIDGTELDWDCPYIYLIGGMDASGALTDPVWRAVLARLTFAPLF